VARAPPHRTEVPLRLHTQPAKGPQSPQRLIVPLLDPFSLAKTGEKELECAHRDDTAVGRPRRYLQLSVLSSTLVLHCALSQCARATTLQFPQAQRTIFSGRNGRT